MKFEDFEKMTNNEKEELRRYLEEPFFTLYERDKKNEKALMMKLEEHIKYLNFDLFLSEENRKKITDLNPETLSQLSNIFELVSKTIQDEMFETNESNAEIRLLHYSSYLISLYLQAFLKMCSKQ